MFLLGHQGHQPHDDDDQEEKDDVEGWRTGGVMSGRPGQTDLVGLEQSGGWVVRCRAFGPMGGGGCGHTIGWVGVWVGANDVLAKIPGLYLVILVVVPPPHSCPPPHHHGANALEVLAKTPCPFLVLELRYP